jgi:hypothetical protein
MIFKVGDLKIGDILILDDRAYLLNEISDTHHHFYRGETSVDDIRVENRDVPRIDKKAYVVHNIYDETDIIYQPSMKLHFLSKVPFDTTYSKRILEILNNWKSIVIDSRINILLNE